jgi:hypothetical protein
MRDDRVDFAPDEFFVILENDDITVVLCHLQGRIRIDLQAHPVTPGFEKDGSKTGAGSGGGPGRSW